ncbi:MAG TPA: HD domain-containing phosphohydrolase, partial [Dissulfurispiraceae bacterium]|nr:HD domain-containing phosphohydrolase [Dissulfurispiraceae bacterium]
GADILRAFDFVPPDALPAVLQHHEKLNGRGYPHRSKDKEIGLFARITAIADSYDAVTTPRPFRPAQSSFNALSLISKETGSYDPNLLKLFVQIFLKMK